MDDDVSRFFEDDSDLDDDFLLHPFGCYEQGNDNDFPANPPRRRNHRASDYADDETADGAAADGAAADAERPASDMAEPEEAPVVLNRETRYTLIYTCNILITLFLFRQASLVAAFLQEMNAFNLGFSFSENTRTAFLGTQEQENRQNNGQVDGHVDGQSDEQGDKQGDQQGDQQDDGQDQLGDPLDLLKEYVLVFYL